MFSKFSSPGLYSAVVFPYLPVDSSKGQTDWRWTVFPLGWIYGVTTIEQILQHNKLGNDANVWTSVQTLAIALLITPAYDLTVAIALLIIPAYDLTVAIWRKVITKRSGGLPQGSTGIGIPDQVLVEDKKRQRRNGGNVNVNRHIHITFVCTLPWVLDYEFLRNANALEMHEVVAPQKLKVPGQCPTISRRRLITPFSSYNK